MRELAECFFRYNSVDLEEFLSYHLKKEKNKHLTKAQLKNQFNLSDMRRHVRRIYVDASE